jgi:hypothetical protein
MSENVERMVPPWQANAQEIGCYCAAYRKPCPYHEGWQDGYDYHAQLIASNVGADGAVPTPRVEPLCAVCQRRHATQGLCGGSFVERPASCPTCGSRDSDERRWVEVEHMPTYSPTADTEYRCDNWAWHSIPTKEG